MIKTLFNSALPVILLLTACSCSAPPDSPSADSLEMSIREIIELPVCEQIYRDIVYLGEQKKVLFFTTSDKEVLFSIDIRVQAGIRNAGMIEISAVNEEQDGIKTASVRLPSSEILLIDADEQSIEQFFIKERGSEISRLEYYDEINRKKTELSEKAVESGLLDKADSNARNIIRSFLKLAGIDRVEFTEAENGR